MLFAMLAALPMLGAGVVASNPRATDADGWFAGAYPNASNYFYAQAVATKVQLQQAVNLTSLRFWGSSENYIFAVLDNVRGFTVRLYDSSFVTPALQYSVVRGSALSESLTGRLNSLDGKEYQFTLPISGRLASGTWWLHVGAVLIDGANGDGWMWSRGMNAGLRFASYSSTWSTWVDNPSDSVAFELSGDLACPLDLDGSDTIDFGDIVLAMLDFGPCVGCATDTDASGTVDFGDIMLLLLELGPCT